MPVFIRPSGPVDSNNAERHEGGNGTGELHLDTGKVAVKGGVTEGTVDPFDFIFDVSGTGKGASETGQGEFSTVAERNSHGSEDINAERMNPA